jgi:hypothetical protein
MSEIFYSQVDSALQDELNARGRAGKTDRSTEALNFMLGKVANVEMTAYENESREKELHILGGTRVRSGEYLPSGTTVNPGFLDDRRGSVETLSWVANEKTGEIQVDSTTTAFVNSSKRIPPYITSADINIGDHSMGLLNKATINITIPNPDRDLNFFESVWLRPGRHVVIAAEHPNSAVITQGLLSGSLPSVEKIKKLNPNLSASDIKRFKKMNRYEFYGLITNFSFVYNEDATVSATINLTGASNVYTDVSLLMSPSKKNRDEIEININTSNNNADTLLELGDRPQFNIITAPQPILAVADITSGNIDLRAPLPLFDDLENEVKDTIVKSRLSSINAPIAVKKSDSNYNWLIDGKPYNSGSVESETYITLSWLVDYMNRVIIDKRKKASTPENGTSTFTDLIKIICTEEEDLCTSNYYSEITSGNPSTIFLFSENKKLNTYGDLVWYRDIKGAPTFQTGDTAYPSRIFINLQYISDIKSIIDKYKNVKTQFTVNSFLKDISILIKKNTGGAINMALITHPEISNALLYYDCNRVRFNKNITPYSVPMFANDQNGNGTIVRDFAFNAKIPDSVKTLSYVLNQNPEEISEVRCSSIYEFHV